MKHKKNKFGFLILSPNWAGAENAIKNIVFSLSKINKNSIIYCNQEIYSHYKNVKGAEVHNLGVLNIKSKLRYLNYVFMYFSLRKFISKEKPANLFINLEGSFFVSMGLSNSFKIPVFVILHGSEIHNFIDSKEKLKSWFLIKCLKKSPKIISISHHQIQNLPEKYKKKTVVIPNGVDTKIFKPLKKIKQKKNVILFAGRFIEIKGIKEILAVAKQLLQYEFWFAGQGPLAKHINLSNTKNLGFKTVKELVKLYNQTTICVQPSRREGMPLIGLEAMSCGKSVIATPLGFSEYIKNGKDGIIIPAKNEEALRKAIVDLMENPKKRKMIEKNARKKALQYSWDKVAKQYLKVFEEVVEESKEVNKKNEEYPK